MRGFQFRYRPHTLDEWVIGEVYGQNCYLKEFVVPFIPRGSLVIDIGAHIGSFTVLAGQLLGPSLIVAIEPEESNFRYLLENIREAGLVHLVKPHQIALWSTEGSLPLYVHSWNTGGHSLLPEKLRLERVDPRAYEKRPIRVTTLDALLLDLRLDNDRVSLVKLDVEGAEAHILEGASRTLARTAVVVGELHEALVPREELSRLLGDFAVVVGHPSPPVGIRPFWAMNRKLLGSHAVREFEARAERQGFECLAGSRCGNMIRTGPKHLPTSNSQPPSQSVADATWEEHPACPDDRPARQATAISTSRDSAAPRMHVLVIDPFFPAYDRASGSRRLYEVIKLLVGLGHDVTFIATHDVGERPYAMELLAEGVEVYSAQGSALREVPTSRLLSLADLLTRVKYDVAWLSFYHVAELYLPVIRTLSPNTRIYVDTVDLHFVREQREAQLFRDPSLSAMASQTKRRELAIYSVADAVVTVSEEESRLLREELPDAVIYVVPNIHRVATQVLPFHVRKGLLFVGNFRHRPNVDAVFHLVRDILPRIHAKLPDVTLTIVGDSPPREIVELASDLIRVTGYVPDINAYLQSHRVSLAPLRYGAGLKGKVGEALAAGIPVVATSVATEGMRMKFVDGPVLLVEDDAGRFADAVVRVYTDQHLWSELSKNGRDYVQRHYAPEVVEQLIREALHFVPTSSRSHMNRPGGNPVDALHRRGGRKHNVSLTIIVPVWTGASITRRCLEAIAKNTRCDYEVVIVDNAAEPEVKVAIEECSGFLKRTKVIHNERNLGYPVACNQGLAVGEGDFLVVMNNDVVVTPHWDARLLAAFSAHPRLGAVGPRTNFAVGPQLVEGAAYDEASLDRWAEEWHRQNAGSLRPVARLIGFLVMLKRELVEQIGGFDPLFGKGNFEDDDYSLRALLAGYKLAIVDDVFVHHYGSRSFREQPDQYATLMEVNRRLFTAKWDIEFRNGAYDPTEVLRRGGYRGTDLYVPLSFESIFSPDVKPFDVGVTASRRLLCVPDPSDTEAAWLDCVRNYLQSFGPADNTTLIVRVEPTDQGWLSYIVGSIERLANEMHVNLDERDDLVIEADRVPSAERGRIYRAANIFVPLPGVRRESLINEARACGLEVLPGYSPEQLRTGAGDWSGLSSQPE